MSYHPHTFLNASAVMTPAATAIAVWVEHFPSVPIFRAGTTIIYSRALPTRFEKSL